MTSPGTSAYNLNILQPIEDMLISKLWEMLLFNTGSNIENKHEWFFPYPFEEFQ